MTDYNDGKWHGWNGGECPVHRESAVEMMTLDGESETGDAGSLDWESTESAWSIIAFRVVKQHREPREAWMVHQIATRLGHTEPTWTQCSDEHPDAVLFREVLDDGEAR